MNTNSSQHEYPPTTEKVKELTRTRLIHNLNDLFYKWSNPPQDRNLSSQISKQILHIGILLGIPNMNYFSPDFQWKIITDYLQQHTLNSPIKSLINQEIKQLNVYLEKQQNPEFLAEIGKDQAIYIKEKINNLKQKLNIPLQEYSPTDPLVNETLHKNDFLEIAEALRSLPYKSRKPPKLPLHSQEPHRDEYISLVKELETIRKLFYTKSLPPYYKAKITQYLEDIKNLLNLNNIDKFSCSLQDMLISHHTLQLEEKIKDIHLQMNGNNILLAPNYYLSLILKSLKLQIDNMFNPTDLDADGQFLEPMGDVESSSHREDIIENCLMFYQKHIHPINNHLMDLLAQLLRIKFKIIFTNNLYKKGQSLAERNEELILAKITNLEGILNILPRNENGSIEERIRNLTDHMQKLPISTKKTPKKLQEKHPSGFTTPYVSKHRIINKITRLQGINDKNNQQASLKEQSCNKIPLRSYNNVTIIKKITKLVGSTYNYIIESGENK